MTRPAEVQVDAGLLRRAAILFGGWGRARRGKAGSEAEQKGSRRKRTGLMDDERRKKVRIRPTVGLVHIYLLITLLDGSRSRMRVCESVMGL